MYMDFFIPSVYIIWLHEQFLHSNLINMFFFYEEEINLERVKKKN